MKTIIDFTTLLNKSEAVQKDIDSNDGSFKEVAQNILWKTGGMPSSHSAMSTALVTVLGFQEGITSPVFFVALFFTTIVLRDAVGVRRDVGRIAHHFNMFVRLFNAQNPKQGFKELKVSEGHSLSEVSVGVLLGVFVGLAVSLF